MIDITQSRLSFLIMNELKEEFIYEIIDSLLHYKIQDFILRNLMALGIHVTKDDITVTVPLDGNSFGVSVSEALEGRLKYFEDCNPEYFI